MKRRNSLPAAPASTSPRASGGPVLPPTLTRVARPRSGGQSLGPVPFRIDAQLPDRPIPAHWCTSQGRWCRKFWVLGPWCLRVDGAPKLHAQLPCPQLHSTVEPARAVVARLQHSTACRHLPVVATGLDGLQTPLQAAAALAGAAWSARRYGTPTMLDAAGLTGRCPVCGRACVVCADPAGPPECRINGYCVVAEWHVAHCAPWLVTWSVADAADPGGLTTRRYYQSRMRHPDTPEPLAVVHNRTQSRAGGR